jgi:hypothetical protein
MAEGDEVLIVEGKTIKLLGRIAGKLISASDDPSAQDSCLAFVSCEGESDFESLAEALVAH